MKILLKDDQKVAIPKSLVIYFDIIALLMKEQKAEDGQEPFLFNLEDFNL